MLCSETEIFQFSNKYLSHAEALSDCTRDDTWIGWPLFVWKNKQIVHYYEVLPVIFLGKGHLFLATRDIALPYVCYMGMCHPLCAACKGICFKPENP